MEIMSAYDLVTIGRYSKFNMLDLFRVFDALDAAKKMGIKLLNANGFLNLYSWINSKDGHIVPHEQLESDFVGEHGAILNIPQNCLLNVRYDVANAVDIHTATLPDGTSTLVRRINGTPRYGRESLSPFYADINALDVFKFRGIYEGRRCNFWIESEANETLGLETKYHLSNMVNNWGEVVFRHFDEHTLGEEMSTFLCSFKFKDKSFPNLDDPIPDDVMTRNLIAPEIKKSAYQIDFVVGEGFLAATRRVDNLAEMTVVLALLRACAEYMAITLSDGEIAKIRNEIIGDDGARHFHSFTARDLPLIFSSRLK